MHYFFWYAAAGSGLITTTMAHMVMITPVPYGATTLTTDPLNGQGNDFPCKQREGVYDITQMNSMAVGEMQTLSWRGIAVHGGGSCQISVSLDTEPTKSSTFKTIKSIEGACPSNATGNLNGDANSHLAAVFDFSLPDGFPNGRATLAWTWLNKHGNREFYMNCAPIEVSGGSDDRSVYDALPDMFVANIPTSSCEVPEGQDFVYPNPGAVVERRDIGTLNYGSAMTGPGCQQGSGGQQGDDSYNTGQGSQASDTGSSPSSNAVAGPQNTATVNGLAGSPGDIPSTNLPSTDAYAACDDGKVSCPIIGAVICIGTSQFGLCNIDNCAIPQDLAAGTSCTNNVISRRSDRHRHRHLDFHKKAHQPAAI